MWQSENKNNRKLKIYLLSLGCVKNQVESEMMSGMLDLYGFVIIDNPTTADIIIVNTCGFLISAREEAIENILELAQWKESGCCRLLLAVGCMPQKYGAEMLSSMPELDGVLGSSEYADIGEFIIEKLSLPEPSVIRPCDPYMLRRLSTPPHTAYIKIADGCDNHCAYCLIPQLRGVYRSRTMESIVTEAKKLLSEDVSELILVAQDTTNYGMDIYGVKALPELLTQLAQLDFHWIRLLYCYPSHITKELLTVMARYDNICHYLDIPLQYADDKVLKNMNRTDTVASLREKIYLIKRYLPDVALRTTIMVGFPGEHGKSWLNMLKFLEDVRFDWVGVFAYSREEDTPAYSLPHQVLESTKQRRLEETHVFLNKLSERRMAAYVGRILEVLTEGRGKDGRYYGRSMYQSPEVDGLVYFTSDVHRKLGSYVAVRITGHDVYDLNGFAI